MSKMFLCQLHICGKQGILKTLQITQVTQNKLRLLQPRQNYYNHKHAITETCKE